MERGDELDGTLGFIEEEFSAGEVPLGLVVDWSMALPVVCGIVPGSAASERELICPGLVILAANRKPFVIGISREEVESSLAVRPLRLLFEAPDSQLFYYSSPAAWKKRAAGSPTRSLGNGVLSQSRSNVTLQPLSTSTKHSASVFFESYPDSSPSPSPISSWKSVGKSSLADRDSSASASPENRRSTRAEHTAPFLPPMSLTWNTGSAMRTASAVRRGGRAARSVTQLWLAIDGSSSVSPVTSDFVGTTNRVRQPQSKSLSWMAAGVPRPDRAYEHLFEHSAPQHGPGHPARWPLGHEEEYVCRLSDLVLCSRIREAYEVGFRGRKRELPAAQMLLCEPGAVSSKVTTPLRKVTCDTCGLALADIDTPGLCYFYYCRRCKKGGNRFELCPPCHALEVLQAEGKHCGQSLHPHFSRCRHASLIRRNQFSSAYPDSPHIRRALCDCCGQQLVVSPLPPNESGEKELALQIYYCPTCRDDLGVRFELCERCARSLMDKGRGLQMLESCM